MQSFCNYQGVRAYHGRYSSYPPCLLPVDWRTRNAHHTGQKLAFFSFNLILTKYHLQDFGNIWEGVAASYVSNICQAY